MEFYRRHWFWMLVLLAVVAAAAVFESLYLEDTMSALGSAAEDIRSASENGNTDLLSARISDFKELWAQKRSMLLALLEHSEINNINEALVSLSANAQSGEDAAIPADIERLIYYIGHIADTQQTALKNIF